jgi:hypothetical protein
MKSKMLFLSVVIAISIFVMFEGCSDDKVHDKSSSASVNLSKKENLNISILLDLSDRISPIKHPNKSMEFYKRDLGYIESIAKGFEQHLRSKPIRQDDDHIQVYFEPEPLNSEINNLASQLKLSFTKDNTTKQSISKISPQYIMASSEIYKLAVAERRYMGSDIWGFFKNKVKDYCIKPNCRNILFILTDGYMFHKDSKFMEGNKSSYLTPELIKSLGLNTSDYIGKAKKNGYRFVKANDNLNNLEVFVLGISPAKGSPFEGDVINSYWSNWFKEMAVNTFVMKQADLPSNLNPIIQKYINP